VALQSEQDVAPAEGENFPALHDEHTELPVVEYLPAVHGVQMVKLLDPVVFEKVPGAQDVQAEANEPEYLPDGQLVHSSGTMSSLIPSTQSLRTLEILSKTSSGR